MPYLNYPGKQPGPGTELVERINWTENGLSGFGCAECGGTCGLGIFDGSWGVPEFAVIGLGVFALFSMFSTTRSGYRSVRKAANNRTRKAKRKRELKEELARL